MNGFSSFSRRPNLGLVAAVAANLLFVAPVWADDKEQLEAESPSEAPPTPAAAPAPPSDERTARNSVYVEGLGAGLLYSVNYEHVLPEEIAVHGGASFYTFGASSTTSSGTTSASAAYLLVPFGVRYLGIGAGSHSLELGVGATVAYVSASGSAPGLSVSGAGMAGFGTANVGYRRQPRDGGFMFRIGAELLYGPGMGFSVEDPAAWGAIPWGYMSLGASF